MSYPLKFEPVYKSLVWGGRNIQKKFNRQISDGNIGESWEVCCRDDGMSIISNGYLKGLTLLEAIKLYKQDLLGTQIYNSSYSSFPLLIKIIDANDRLSVQVHPDDEYAKLNGEGNGKTELWYVIDAKPGAKLIYGIKEGISPDEFNMAVQAGNVEEYLHFVPVKAGDVFYIPAGTVHAILDGILLAEIQQNSNTTYRLYDWNRVDINGKPRELNIKKALDVIDFGHKHTENGAGHIFNNDSYSLKTLIKDRYFTVEELKVQNTYTDTSDGSKFIIYMLTEGEGIIKYGLEHESINMGETVLMPSNLGDYEITGQFKGLRIYV